MHNMSALPHFCAPSNEECLNSFRAACSVTLRKINSEPECPHGWKEPAWPSLEHKDLLLGDLDFWKDLAEARKGWCSCRALGAQESPALGVLKGLSPLHFKRCQCFYVLMCSLTQPASPGTVCCATLSILSQFFFKQFGAFSPSGEILLFLSLILWIALPWALQIREALGWKLLPKLHSRLFWGPKTV